MKISINTNYNPNKDKSFNNDKVADGWLVTDYKWNEDELRQLVTENGISFNKFKHGIRKNVTWQNRGSSYKGYW